MQANRVEILEKALKNLGKIPSPSKEQIINDIFELQVPISQWQFGKVKPLAHHKPFWELKSGDYRSFFVIEKNKVTVFRIIHRKDLERTLKVL